MRRQPTSPNQPRRYKKKTLLKRCRGVYECRNSTRWTQYFVATESRNLYRIGYCAVHHIFRLTVPDARSSPCSRRHHRSSPAPTCHLPGTPGHQQRSPTRTQESRPCAFDGSISTDRSRHIYIGIVLQDVATTTAVPFLQLRPCHFPTRLMMRCSLAVRAVTGESGGWVPRDSRPHAAKTRLSQPPAAGGFNGNLGCGLPGSKREDCQSARNNKESLQMQQTTAAASFAPVVAHPDAARRRQEAARR